MQPDAQKQLFQQLMEQHKGILFKVARAYCADETDRQDLLQDIMIQVWQAFQQYNDRFKFSTWLYRIALNVAISFYRKNTTRKSKYTVLTEQISPIQEPENVEKELHLNLLEQFIHELKELDKALILLYLEDKSHAEIAEILGISVSNVSTKVGRIKDKLKQRFSQHNL